MRRALAKVRLRTLARRRTVLFRHLRRPDRRHRRGPRQDTGPPRGGVRRWVRVIAGEREPGAGCHRVRAKVTKKGRRLARSRRTLPLELRLSFTDLARRSLWATTTLTLRR